MGEEQNLDYSDCNLVRVFWRYTYELEDFFTYIEKLRPIVELKEHDFNDDQGDGLVRRALGVQG